MSWAWVRGPDGGLVKKDVPSRECLTRGCTRPLTMIREQHQRSQGDVAWRWECGRGHKFFDLQGAGDLVKIR